MVQILAWAAFPGCMLEIDSQALPWTGGIAAGAPGWGGRMLITGFLFRAAPAAYGSSRASG